MTDKVLQNKAKAMRRDILTMAYNAHSAHISSSLCIADILTVLYWDVMKIDPKKPKSPKRDKFVLSKGHAAMALYAVLAQKGFFPKKKLKEYHKDGSLLGDHPIYGIAGIELGTGSLGHGLPVAVGMALASKLDKINNRTFVLISDAESQEGTVWEAFEQKLKSFGWNTYTVNGHNFKELKKYLRKKSLKKPTALICDTIGGKGVSFMENNFEWHYKNIDKELYKKAIEEIDKQ
jgi:transketolase